VLGPSHPTRANARAPPRDPRPAIRLPRTPRNL